jgi:hypothetical protein
LVLQIVSKKRDEFDVEHSQGRRWNYVRLTLPPYIPETHLEFCDIIEVDYFFQFRVEISGGAELKMEAPLLIGSHMPGEEGPRRKAAAANHAHINSQWTVRGAPALDFSNFNDMDHTEPHHQWGQTTGVPELRGDKVVVNNPLFRQGSIVRQGPDNYGNGKMAFGGGGGQREIPEEQMENTRL